jgi:hypothetical protein
LFSMATPPQKADTDAGHYHTWNYTTPGAARQ